MVKNQTKKLDQISTALEHAEQKLHVSEGRYRQLIENIGCVIICVNLDGKITYCNKFALRFFGVTKKQICGTDIIGTIITQDGLSGDIKDSIIKIKESESVGKGGRRVWVAWSNMLIHDEEQNTSEIICVGHDITERKQMENQLYLLAEAVQNSNDAIIIHDLSGGIISWNLGAERTYGYTQAEAMKMNISRIIPSHKQDEWTLITQRAVEGENIESFSTQRITKNNRMLDVSVNATCLKDENLKPFAITTTERDITERRRMEKEFLEITERERELIGQEIHDGMGQVLTGIAVMSKGLALNLKGKLSEEMENALTISKLASKAIAQTRDIAKMLCPVDIETGGLVSALTKLASTTETIMGVKCRFQCGKSVSVKDLVEAKQIYRIVQEAATNAVRHGKAKNINIKLRSTKKGMVLSIENDGMNFPAVSGNKRGFGLRIMQYRVDLIGGSLDIRKGDKEGTVVTCVFPDGNQFSR
jgi:PAS domain S-box-containing protein